MYALIIPALLLLLLLLPLVLPTNANFLEPLVLPANANFLEPTNANFLEPRANWLECLNPSPPEVIFDMCGHGGYGVSRGMY